MRKKVIIIYLICVVLAIFGVIYDSYISSWIAQNRVVFLNDFMVWISYIGTWAFVLIFMTTLFMIQENKRKWVVPLWASVVVSAIIAYSLKLFIMRPRPYEVLNIVPLSDISTDGSFPSGHATAVFSTLAILDKEFPKIKWFWLGFACLVTFSRVYLGLHYFTDVLVGALIGFTVSLFFLKYHKLLSFEKKPVIIKTKGKKK